MTAEGLCAWRERLGYSLTTAAEALGVNRSTYYRMEVGASRVGRRTALACAYLEQCKKKQTNP